MENMIILKTISIFVTFLGAVDYAMSELTCENKFYSLETEGSKLHVYCNCDVIYCEVTNCDNEYENIHKLETYGCSTKDILLLTNIFKTIPVNQVYKIQYNFHRNFIHGNDGKVVELSQEFFDNFPSLFEIDVKHSNISIKEEIISWPKTLKSLHFYGSSQLTLPIIADSKITNLEVADWPNLKNISAIRYLHTLESLTLKNLENLKWVLWERFYFTIIYDIFLCCIFLNVFYTLVG